MASKILEYGLNEWRVDNIYNNYYNIVVVIVITNYDKSMN